MSEIEELMAQVEELRGQVDVMSQVSPQSDWAGAFVVVGNGFCFSTNNLGMFKVMKLEERLKSLEEQVEEIHEWMERVNLLEIGRDLREIKESLFSKRS